MGCGLLYEEKENWVISLLPKRKRTKKEQKNKEAKHKKNIYLVVVWGERFNVNKNNGSHV